MSGSSHLLSWCSLHVSRWLLTTSLSWWLLTATFGSTTISWCTAALCRRLFTTLGWRLSLLLLLWLGIHLWLGLCLLSSTAHIHILWSSWLHLLPVHLRHHLLVWLLHHLLLVWIVLLLVHLTITIDWWQLANAWPLLPHHAVGLLVLLNLPRQLLNLDVLHLELPLHIAVVDTRAVHSTSGAHGQLIDLHVILPDLLPESMALLPLIVDLLEQVHILGHDL